MKFKTRNNTLQKGISIVEKAVSNRTSLPILENIFLELKEGHLKLRGNDLEIGIENIAKHEAELLDYASQKINEIEGVEIIGNAKDKASVLSFIMKNIHPHDIGTIMDSHGVAIRAGNHCTQPVMDFYSIPATARASFAIYNDKKDVDKLISSVRKTMEVFGWVILTNYTRKLF